MTLIEQLTQIRAERDDLYGLVAAMQKRLATTFTYNLQADVRWERDWLHRAVNILNNHGEGSQ